MPIFHDDRMRILEIPTLWIFWLTQRGRSRRPNTWKSYAAELLDYLHYCEANELDYLDPVRGQLAAYRDQLLSRLIVRRNVERRLSNKTINHRLIVAASFYDWMLQEELIQALPFRREERRCPPADVDMLAHIRKGRGRGTDASVPNDSNAVPRALAISIIVMILRDFCERDLLIASLGLSTGARIDEVLALNVDQIPNDQSNSARKAVAVYITETKGLRPRNIYIPLPILTDVNRYIYGERAALRRKLKSQGKEVNENALFLSQKGTRLSYKTYWSTFRAAADKANSNATIHDLRHTFAIYTLVRLRAENRAAASPRAADPLSQLQGLLGHIDISTTEIYVRALKVDPAAAENAMNDFVAQWYRHA